MNATHRSASSRSRRTDAAQRAQWLADFDRSGLSAAAFARQRGLNYTTFRGWRERRDEAKGSPAFVEVELPAPTPPVELVIEVGACARLRINFPAHAARKLRGAVIRAAEALY